MSDLDDDLLALAGFGGAGSAPSAKQLDREIPSSPSEDSDALNDEDEDDDQQTGLSNPYPLEGRYKDEEDREKLQALPELEREQILGNRAEEIQKLRERRDLAQRLKTQKLADTRPSARTVESKRDKLAELKNKRLERSGRGAPDEASPKKRKRKYEESDSEVEWASDEEEKPKEEIDFKDINSVRIGPTQFSKFVHHPLFVDAVKDCFVRINLGPGGPNGEKVYRVGQIRKIVSSRLYMCRDRQVDVALMVAVGSNEKQFEMQYCSDSPITEKELEWWKALLRKDEIRIPSKRFLVKKTDALKEMATHKLSTAEFDTMIAKKKVLQRNPTNFVTERSTLMSLQKKALQEGDAETAEKLADKLFSLEEMTTKRKVHDVDKMTAVNERNRKRNLEEIRKAEIRQNDERRRQEQSGTSNPFNRLKTNARTFYPSNDNSRSTTPLPEDRAPVSQVVVSAKPVAVVETATATQKTLDKIVKGKALGDIDDVIAGAQMDLDIDIEV